MFYLSCWMLCIVGLAASLHATRRLLMLGKTSLKFRVWTFLNDTFRLFGTIQRLVDSSNLFQFQHFHVGCRIGILQRTFLPSYSRSRLATTSHISSFTADFIYNIATHLGYETLKDYLLVVVSMASWKVRYTSYLLFHLSLVLYFMIHAQIRF